MFTMANYIMVAIIKKELKETQGTYLQNTFLIICIASSKCHGILSILVSNFFNRYTPPCLSSCFLQFLQVRCWIVEVVQVLCYICWQVRYCTGTQYYLKNKQQYFFLKKSLILDSFIIQSSSFRLHFPPAWKISHIVIRDSYANSHNCRENTGVSRPCVLISCWNSKKMWPHQQTKKFCQCTGLRILYCSANLSHAWWLCWVTFVFFEDSREWLGDCCRFLWHKPTFACCCHSGRAHWSTLYFCSSITWKVGDHFFEYIFWDIRTLLFRIWDPLIYPSVKFYVHPCDNPQWLSCPSH